MTEPANLQYSSIREYAQLVAEHHAIYDDSGRAGVEVLVKKLGGKIEYGDSRESLRVKDQKQFTIVLPNMTSARRDRFTVAHELGHYFLHYLFAKKKGTEVFGRGERNLAETQANVFAAALLMPAKQFRAAHKELNGDPWALAARFDVSPAAVEVQSQVLNL